MHSRPRALWAAIALAFLPAAQAMAEEPPARASPATDTPDAATVVQEYFSLVRARDTGIYRLFHPDAVLNGLGMQTRGREAIRDFYARAIATGSPQPRLAGPLLVGEGRVAAEIFIDLASGQTLHVVDLFVVEEGLIRSLTYFLASEPPSSPAPRN